MIKTSPAIASHRSWGKRQHPLSAHAAAEEPIPEVSVVVVGFGFCLSSLAEWPRGLPTVGSLCGTGLSPSLESSSSEPVAGGARHRGRAEEEEEVRGG